jgi:hypothetical protein
MRDLDAAAASRHNGGVIAAELVLIVVCLVCLACAALALARLRLILGKSRTAALTFAVPGALLALPSAWLVADGALLALVPLATVALLCLAAAVLFLPTAGTRFAAFEREFWAHVERSG